MPIVQEYQAFRQRSKELIHEVMRKTLKREVTDMAGSLLGIRQGKVLVLDSEEEMSILFDFALNDCLVSGKNAVEEYR